MSLLSVKSSQGLQQLWIAFFVQVQHDTGMPLSCWPRRVGKAQLVRQMSALAKRLSDAVHWGLMVPQRVDRELATLNYFKGQFWMSLRGKQVGEALRWPFYHGSPIPPHGATISQLHFLLTTLYPELPLFPTTADTLPHFLQDQGQCTRLRLSAHGWQVIPSVSAALLSTPPLIHSSPTEPL